MVLLWLVVPGQALGCEFVLAVALRAAGGGLAPGHERHDHERHPDREQQPGDAEHPAELAVDQPGDRAGDRGAEQTDPRDLGPVGAAVLADQQLRDPAGRERDANHPEHHDHEAHRFPPVMRTRGG